jgi:two-component system phosphate regulon sensor histidine kinase PhoR
MANQQDEVSGVVTILRDVTREKEVSAMKSDFVSSVSHELRTPLSSIKAYVEMLVDGEAADEQTRAEFYNVIQSETNRLSRLIDNILNISRIESGVVKIQRENVSLPMVIREVMDVMLPQARAKQIELVDQPSPLVFQVYADKDRVYQALLNLVGNAIKYTPEGGTVMVRLDMEEQGQFARIQVSDTGMGIPADAIDHVFDKFYRVNGHKKVAKGTGLGLNLVKHIVETVHGGKVAVDSQENQGSTFTIALPVADAVPA